MSQKSLTKCALDVTFRFDRPSNVLNRNVDWLLIIRENRDDNWEKNVSTSFFSLPHMKQSNILRCFDSAVWLVDPSVDKNCSTDDRSCSLETDFASHWAYRFTIGISKSNTAFANKIRFENTYDQYSNEVFSVERYLVVVFEHWLRRTDNLLENKVGTSLRENS